MKKIVVTGGTGFLGKHVCKKLHETNIQPIQLGSKDFDLTCEEDVIKMYDQHSPDVVIHLAAVVGGIGINQRKPGTFYYKNLIMGTHLIEHARRRSISKFVAIGTVCSYPKFTPVPFSENDIWNGYPEETNAAYGLAKKMMLVQLQAYRQEFGFNGIYLMPVNLYGPHDNFDPDSSHVIPALIKKCIDARNNNDESITCWGTGAATREFLYVEDAADAIVRATLMYNKADPVNIGAGTEISIKNLVTIIANLVGFKGIIKWDSTRPDGQPRRCLDTTRAKYSFDFKATTDFETGLRKTIEWYETTNRAAEGTDAIADIEYFKRKIGAPRQYSGFESPTKISIPVSAGELLDKITILRIKKDSIKNAASLVNIETELEALTTIYKDTIQQQLNVDITNELTKLFVELQKINLIIWGIEDKIRECERHKNFSDEFIQLARSVYINNDQRASIKKKINGLLTSHIVEEKSYTEYKE